MTTQQTWQNYCRIIWKLTISSPPTHYPKRPLGGAKGMNVPWCTLLVAQARTNAPWCTLLMTQTRTNTPRCTLWVAQARVNTPQCYFKVCRAGRTPYLYSSREFTEHLRTFLKIQKNCVLRALLPFGGHLATFHKDAFRFLHRNSSYICLNCTFSFFTSTLSFSAQRNVIKGSGGLHLV